MQIFLTPDQQAWLASRVERGEFASIDEAARHLIGERIAERMIEEDDLGWAKSLVDEARADMATGRVVSAEERHARMLALLSSAKD
jgi:antitoxin ParD1/3/4